jgi:preprotein translocase subunit Sec61beta
MSKDERITTPQSSTGIIRFYDADTGGPKLDARAVVIFTVVAILFIKIASLIIA